MTLDSFYRIHDRRWGVWISSFGSTRIWRVPPSESTVKIILSLDPPPPRPTVPLPLGYRPLLEISGITNHSINKTEENTWRARLLLTPRPYFNKQGRRRGRNRIIDDNSREISFIFTTPTYLFYAVLVYLFVESVTDGQRKIYIYEVLLFFYCKFRLLTINFNIWGVISSKYYTLFEGEFYLNLATG